MKSLDKQSKKVLNNFLYEISKEYHQEIPLEFIFRVCEDNGAIPIAEDGERWSGFICGREGRTNFNLRNASNNEELRNTLFLSWYKMPSGRYEINSYIS